MADDGSVLLTNTTSLSAITGLGIALPDRAALSLPNLGIGCTVPLGAGRMDRSRLFGESK